MRFMIIVKATKDTEAGVMPEDDKIFSAMAKYHEELQKAGMLLDASGLQPTSKGWRIKYSGEKRTVIDGAFAEGALQLTAREGVVMLAGQKRRGYVMELKIMDQNRAKIFFTEAGELALVEMTDGWRALDPIIYGLVPEIPEPEE